MITSQCVSCFFFGKSSVQFVNCSWRTLQNRRNTYHIYSMSAATNINVHLYLHCRAYLRTANISHFPFENSKVIISQYVVSFSQMARKFYFCPQVVPPALFWDGKRLKILSVPADQAISGGAYSLIEW